MAQKVSNFMRNRVDYDNIRTIKNNKKSKLIYFTIVSFLICTPY